MDEPTSLTPSSRVRVVRHVPYVMRRTTWGKRRGREDERRKARIRMIIWRKRERSEQQRPCKLLENAGKPENAPLTHGAPLSCLVAGHFDVAHYGASEVLKHRLEREGG